MNHAVAAHATEQLLAQVIAQLIIMIVAARAGNRLFRRMGQPGVIGEIVAGLLLGPSLFGHVLPGVSKALFTDASAPIIRILAQIGLVMLMVQIGSGFDFARLGSARLKRLTLAVAVPSIAVPLALGFGLGRWTAPTLAPGIDAVAYSLFCGVALSITAVPILGRILIERSLEATDLGVVAIAAAAINDVVGWLLLAGVSAYTAATLDGGFAMRLGLLIVFMLAMRWLLGPIVARLVGRLPGGDAPLSPDVLAIMICLAYALALCTYELGIFAIFGGFAAGLLYHRHPRLVALWDRQVSGLVLVFFLPIFFTYTGLHTDLLGLGMADWGWLALVMAAAVLGKIVPVFLAARACGEAPRPAFTLATLMNTRALMELIVLDAGRSLGVIPAKMFTMLVVMAVATTLMTGPLLTWLLPRTRLRGI